MSLKLGVFSYKDIKGSAAKNGMSEADAGALLDEYATATRRINVPDYMSAEYYPELPKEIEIVYEDSHKHPLFIAGQCIVYSFPGKPPLLLPTEHRNHNNLRALFSNPPPAETTIAEIGKLASVDDDAKFTDRMEAVKMLHAWGAEQIIHHNAVTMATTKPRHTKYLEQMGLQVIPLWHKKERDYSFLVPKTMDLRIMPDYPIPEGAEIKTKDKNAAESIGMS